MIGVQGSNTVHQRKNLDGDQRLTIAKNLGIPLDEDSIRKAKFNHPGSDSLEVKYLIARRAKLGGQIPERNTDCIKLKAPSLNSFASLLSGKNKKPQSTTMVLVRILTILLREKSLYKYIVPIVPDEARTFGLDALFKIAGIFSLQGQQYTPVDANSLVAYREAEDGQILQEGICEICLLYTSPSPRD